MTCAMIILALSSWSEAKDLMIASVGAGLVPALCSRLLFWAPTRDAPTVSVLCYLWGGHTGTAPTGAPYRRSGGYVIRRV